LRGEGGYPEFQSHCIEVEDARIIWAWKMFHEADEEAEEAEDETEDATGSEDAVAADR
jgi:hypothetical protein